MKGMENDLLIVLGITIAIIATGSLVFYLGYLYGKISEKQTKKERWKECKIINY